MFRRFLLYGMAGWIAEVLFTGAASALEHDEAATARTYLWMHPIYGGTALLLERCEHRLQHAPRWARALAYTAVMEAAEFGSGWLLRRALGKCPWDYTDHGWNVKGLVRLDYAPAWLALALLFEPLRARIDAMSQKSPTLKWTATSDSSSSRSGFRLKPRSRASAPTGVT